MPEGDRTQLDIRRFQSGDGKPIRELNELAMATTPEYVPDAPDEDLRNIQCYYLDGEGEFLVGTVNETLVATGAYATPSAWKEEYIDLGSNTNELTRMRVDPEYHGQGIGSAIYHELEQRARSDGYETFVLDTGVENDAARGFYESHGFQLQQEASIAFGDLTIELALYQKSIES